MALATYSKLCSKNISGNSKIFIAEAANISAIVVTAGEISSITGAGAFKVIEADLDSIIRTEEKVAGKLNHAYDISLDLKVSKPSKDVNTLRNSLSDASPCGMLALVRDNNGTWWLVGYNETDLLSRPLYLSEDIMNSGESPFDEEAARTNIKLVRSMADPSLPLDATLGAAMDAETADFAQFSLYVSQFQAVYNSWSVKPSTAVADAMNTMVQSLVSAGVWTKLDCLYILAAHAETESLTNWVNPGTYDISKVGSPTFTAYEGFLGSTSNYLNTGFNPISHGVQWSQNSAVMGLYSRTDVSSSAYDMGYDGSSDVTIQSNSGGNALGKINSATNLSGAVSDSLGMTAIARPDASNQEIHRNGTQLNTGAVASAGEANGAIFICCRSAGGTPSSYSTRQISLGFIGGYLTSTERTALFNAFETYMDSNGKGVVT